MGRFALSLLAVAVLAGCPYQPLAYDENVPSMEDAVKHPTIVVHGRSTVVWQAQNGEGALTGEFCRTTADVSGWLSPDLNDESCVGCQDVYTLELDENSSNCDFGMAQFAVIAFTPLTALNPGYAQSYGQWFDTNGADSFLQVRWTPSGQTGWRPGLGVFDGGWPDDEVECDADICGESRYYHCRNEAQGCGRWYLEMDIESGG